MLISVAMATYNGAKYIKEQLDSITNQTHKEIEIIIVDDCSTDETREIINNYTDARILLIKNDQNYGCTVSFQKAIEHCKGQYIALCDQDDIWVAKKLEILLESINGYSLVYSDNKFIDANGKEIIAPASYTNKLHGKDSLTEKFELYTLFNSFILGCSIMFERELVSKILPIYDNGYNHDKWIVFHAALNKGIKYIDESLFFYRLHGGNLSQNTKIKSSKPKVPFFPYDIVRLSYNTNLSNNKTKNLIKLINNLDKSRTKKIKVIILYRKYFAARYNYITRLKQFIKFVLLS